MKRIYLFLLLTLFPVQPEPACSGGLLSYLTADNINYSKETGIVVAKGNVQVNNHGRLIMGDFATLNNTTGDGVVEGNVMIVDDEEYIVCKKVTFNQKSKQGLIYEGSGVIANSFYFSGKKIEQVSGNRYRVLDGSFTSCCEKSPLWKIGASKADIHVEGYAFLTHPTLKIKNIPVLYLPYFIFPVKTKRQTGFMRPGIGGGGRDGFIFTNSFYWAITESQDATFQWERKDLRGDKFDIEYRYVFSRNMFGTVNYTYFEDHDPDKKIITIYRKLLLDHNNIFPYGVQGIAHIEELSDEANIDRDYEVQDLEANTKRETDSHVRLTKSWGTQNLQLLVRRRDSTDPENRVRYEEFPDLSFISQSRQFFVTPLYFSFDASLKGFREETETDTSKGFQIGTLKGEVLEVNRTDLYPKFSLPIPLFPWFSLTPSIAWRETYYTFGKKGKGFYREFYEMGLAAAGPKFYKIFQSEDIGVKHIIEPALTYTHMSQIDDTVSNQIVRVFDPIDSLGSTEEPVNRFNFSITNRFLRKIGDKSANEIATLTLSQGFDLQKDKLEDKEEEPRRSFSDLLIRLETNIIPSVKVSYYNTYNVYSKITFKDAMELDINFPGKGYFTLSRRFERSMDGLYVGNSDKIEDIGTVGINLFGQLRFEMAKQFDELNHIFERNDYSLVYSSGCWEIAYDLTNYRRIPDGAVIADLKKDELPTYSYDTRFFITITLKNMGTSRERQTLGFIKNRF